MSACSGGSEKERGIFLTLYSAVEDVKKSEFEGLKCSQVMITCRVCSMQSLCWVRLINRTCKS